MSAISLSTFVIGDSELASRVRRLDSVGVVEEVEHGNTDFLGKAVGVGSALVIEPTWNPVSDVDVEAVVSQYLARPEISHLAVTAVPEDAWGDPRVVTCLVSASQRLFYASRGPLPGSHDRAYVKALALAGVSVWTSQDVALLREGEPGPLEQLEQFPLMRVLEADQHVQAVDVTGIGRV